MRLFTVMSCAPLLVASCSSAAPQPVSSGGGSEEVSPSPTGHHGHGGHGEHGSPEGDGGYRHHTAHHRFDDPERWAGHFEDPARDAWQRPERVVELLALEPSHRVADIGSATGYFPVRLARAVPEGRVWGVDIEPSMVAYLNARARREGLDNLFSVLGTAPDPLLPEPVDLVLVVNTYHHIEGRTAYFDRLRAHLTAGGRVAIVDFRMGDIPVGPPEAARIAPDQVQRELEAAGYRVALDDRDSLPHQFVMIFAVTAPDPAS